MSESTPSFEDASVAAVLAQRNREDRAALLEELVATLSDVVPGAKVERSMLRRHVTSLHLPLGGFVYILKKNDDSFDASRQQEVRGVVVRTVPLEIDAFLAELGLALDVELRRTERGRNALRDWLNSGNS